MNVNALRSADVRSPFSVVAPAVVERVGVGGVDSFRFKGAKRETVSGAESLAKCSTSWESVIGLAVVRFCEGEGQVLPHTQCQRKLGGCILSESPLRSKLLRE